MPLGLHQGIEYGLAIILATTAIHISGRAEFTMLAGAVLLAALAAFTRGPLAAFRALSARPHRIGEVVVGVALVCSPLASLAHPSAVAIGLLVASGLVLLRVAYAGISPPRPPRPARPTSSPAPPVNVATPARPANVAAPAAPLRPDQVFAGPPPPSPGVGASQMQDQPTAVSGVGPPGGAARSEEPAPRSGPSALEVGARAAGRVTGRARRKVADAAPLADEALGRGARRLGAVVGRRAARKATR
ncbi:MAG: hypothetical protein ACRDY2_06270 [Acidimicrobiales bacterium]